MFVVVRGTDVDASKVRVKKPVRLSAACSAYNITYDDGKTKLVVQTPAMNMAHPVLYEAKGAQEYAKVGLCGRRPVHDAFYKSMAAVSDRVSAKLHAAYPDDFRDKARASFVTKENTHALNSEAGVEHEENRREVDDSRIGNKEEEPIVRLRLKNVRAAVTVFDVNKRNVGHDVLMRNDSVVAVFTMEYVWTTASAWGFECRLVQLLKIDPLPIGGGAALFFSVAQDDEDTKNAGDADVRGGHTSYSSIQQRRERRGTGGSVTPVAANNNKYLKMLKFGVPPLAVRNALIVDGVPGAAERAQTGGLDTDDKIKRFFFFDESSSSCAAPRAAAPETETVTPRVASSQQTASSAGPPRPPPRPPRPPPPPPPPFSITSQRSGVVGDAQRKKGESNVCAPPQASGGGMFAVLAQIAKGQFSLRPKSAVPPAAEPAAIPTSAPSASGRPAETLGTTTKPHSTSSSPLVPSLADILGAKQRLRSVRDRDRPDARHQTQVGGDTSGDHRAAAYAPHDTFPFLREIRSGNFRLRKVEPT